MTNALIITAYSGTTPRKDTGLENAENVTYSTIYPGGLFGDCTFTLKRDVTAGWSVQLNDRIVIRNGLKTVYEGYLTNIAITQDEAEQAFICTCLGAWGNFLMQRKTQKPWAIRDVSDQTWQMQVPDGGGGDEQWYGTDRTWNQLIVYPNQGTDFASGDDVRIRFTAPKGHTIKRLAYTLYFEVGGQSWETYLYAVDPSPTIIASTQYNSDQSATAVDYTFVTPRNSVDIRVESKATQTAPKSAGDANKVRAAYKDLIVYTETGDIDLTAITVDVAGYISELSTDTSLIADNSMQMSSFYADLSGETYADLLTRLASYGDSNFAAWAIGVRESDLASDSKPIMFAELQPALTSYDYAVRLDEPTLVAPFQAEQDISTVRNYVVVTYQDAAGNSVSITPTDDAGLTDATSVAAYGQREEWLTLDTQDATIAAAYGKRFLAQNKDPRWTCSSGVTVVGSIRTSGGGSIPSSEIRAGKRVRVENFLNDLSGTGLTFLVTGTNYDDTTETCQMSVGQPNGLDVWLARQLRWLDIHRG